MPASANASPSSSARSEPTVARSLPCDLHRILREGWPRAGAVVVADNIRFPGAPDYLAYMRAQEGKTWRSVEHETHVEYQSVIKDMVLVSTYLGPADA